MAKRRSRSDSDEEHYQSDNSVSDVASKPVKSNTKQKSKRQEKQTTPATNSIKKPKLDPESDDQGVTTLRRNDEGNGYIELGKKRRVTVREFKGQTLIDIREFYGDDGEERPGKKGISLTVEQWHTLKGCLEQIDSLVADLKPKK